MKKFPLLNKFGLLLIEVFLVYSLIGFLFFILLDVPFIDFVLSTPMFIEYCMESFREKPIAFLFYALVILFTCAVLGLFHMIMLAIDFINIFFTISLTKKNKFMIFKYKTVVYIVCYYVFNHEKTIRLLEIFFHIIITFKWGLCEDRDLQVIVDLAKPVSENPNRGILDQLSEIPREIQQIRETGMQDLQNRGILNSIPAEILMNLKAFEIIQDYLRFYGNFEYDPIVMEELSIALKTLPKEFNESLKFSGSDFVEDFLIQIEKTHQTHSSATSASANTDGHVVSSSSTEHEALVGIQSVELDDLELELKRKHSITFNPPAPTSSPDERLLTDPFFDGLIIKSAIPLLDSSLANFVQTSLKTLSRVDQQKDLSLAAKRVMLYTFCKTIKTLFGVKGLKA